MSSTTLLQRLLMLSAAVLAAIGGVLAPFTSEVAAVPVIMALLLVAGALGGLRYADRTPLFAALVLGIASSLVAALLLQIVEAAPGVVFWCLVLGSCLLAWSCVEQLSRLEPPGSLSRLALALAIPGLFGLWLLLLREFLTVGLAIPPDAGEHRGRLGYPHPISITTRAGA